MFFTRIALRNISAYKDSGWIELSPGINLVVGQNNVGKTALLRGFESTLRDDRHRNLAAFQYERLARPQFDCDLRLSGAELEEAILSFNGNVQWPIPDNRQSIAGIIDEIRDTNFNFALSRNPSVQYWSRQHPSHGLFHGSGQRHVVLKAKDGRLDLSGPHPASRDSVDVPVNVAVAKRLFLFNAQRYSIGKANQGRSERLSPSAENLAQILMIMQGERGDLFRILVGNICEIFPTIGNLSVTTDGSRFDIRVWPTEKMERAELSVGLDDSGTGIAQAIAILTVMMTMDQAVIVIDEISSFLHPAAVKSLLRIMQTQYPNHQYIIATHSSEVLTTGNPSAVYLVRRRDYESEVTKVDLKNLDQLRAVTGELGISMTDVFAAERIIWVEGPTEELCFPYIFEVSSGPLPRGLAIVPVVATGDFMRKSRRRDLIFEIYKRLAESTAPLVKSVKFSFDTEELDDDQMAELRRSAGGNLHFLPRRHFECFLVDPAAIAELIVKRVPDLRDRLRADAVLQRLAVLGGDARFRAAEYWAGDTHSEEWLRHVDAARLINAVCSELTESRFEFSKTRDSLELLRHIMANNRESLMLLIGYIRLLVAGAEGESRA